MRFSKNYEKHTPRVSHSYRDSRQGLVQARTLARCSRKLQKIWRTAFSPPQTVDKVGAGSYPQHHFSVNSLCFNKNLKKLQDSFILDSLISKIFASFFKFIHANVSPAFISIRAFPMY